MATQKQIDANRRNSGKSTGPRSASGKKRASYNAYRHGLSRPLLGIEHRRAVEALASRILADHGKAKDQHALAPAREIAEAEFELARVRRIKVALVERAHNPKCAVDALPAMPEEEPQRTAEAVRRVLPELARLARYEARASKRRDRAIHSLVLRRIVFNNT
jgi:hypothetical protein